ncbi:MAG TPA: FAD-dependent oxidoreductase [Gammaproteobacteria bacterium]|nr:FAD-dependent oxidoreductase [Gammaproteobacteria bacterium]HAT26852.1 FAD-dependent oxidoreductase [Gammaproteobacteria bacterium]
MTAHFDIVIIGAGIAGVSVAAELAATAKVVVLEMEAQPGSHATGRSAAFFAAAYGSDVVRGITAACEHFYRSPPPGFTEVELLHPRDALFIARAGQSLQLDEMKRDIPALLQVSAVAACKQVPILDQRYVAAALRDDQGGDLDVDAILQAYLRLLKRRGGELRCRQRVTALNHHKGTWTLQLGNESIDAAIVVNAAGAWAAKLGELAGLKGLDLIPRKRTALLISPPADLDIGAWPLVVDVDEEFYFKPDAGQLLISPADATPCEPCDAQADELDIAIAVDRFEKATSFRVQRVNHSWAGLRTFVSDGNFVAGFDPRADGFFWLAAQGGYGVQSAPALAQLSNALITGASLVGDFSQLLSYCEAVAPDRLIKHR